MKKLYISVSGFEIDVRVFDNRTMRRFECQNWETVLVWLACNNIRFSDYKIKVRGH